MVLSKNYRVLCRSTATGSSNVALQRRDTGDVLVFDGIGNVVQIGMKQLLPASR